MLEQISYKVYLDRLKQHQLRVECTIQNPLEEGQIVSMPVWVPGSYAIREFAKHIVSINAHSGTNAVPMQKISKNTWVCAPTNGPLTISYVLYCFDPSARGAYVDHLRAFFDGCRVFLVVVGEEEQNCSVEIVRPDSEAANWRVATSMTPGKIDSNGFGKYVAENHLDLIDHPFEIGNLQVFEFMVAGVLHQIVVNNDVVADFPRLCADVQKICASEVEFFGELPPIRKYVFLLSVLAKGGGGIEHRASSSLICNRAALPKVGEEIKTEEYKSLLGLFSHEYFHLWNVKRIKPEVFINPDLNEEVYTRQLWIFEGITAYYDNLFLVFSGMITPKEYIKILEDDINLLLSTPGAKFQTLEESSFDAWIKYYQPDENSVNAAVSYYLKGCLVALALDLLIIKNSKRKQSLSDIMQVLWQQYGKIGLGVPENYFERLTFEVTGEDYSEFFDKALRSTNSLDFTHMLELVGVNYKPIAPGLLDNFGFKVAPDQPKVIVRSVLTDSVAEFAALAPNDVIIAVNNLAVTTQNLEATLLYFREAENLKLHVFRNEVLLELNLPNPPLMKTICALEYMSVVSEQQEHNRKKWLGI